MIYKAVANVPPTYLTAALGTTGFLLKHFNPWLNVLFDFYCLHIESSLCT